ncbi:MAG: fused MFS/spermidine synthase [Clostridium sp.]|nr:fused MFS/spermidine synthase [Clostridium sp.]
MREKSILHNKFYLYLTEFFAGMSVMAVELGASRLLAPYFSSSQIVWTIIIGTIMIAMALGNIYGGRSADKNPNPDKLYGRMIIAAVWIAAIPVLGKYIILGISAVLIFSVNQNFLIWAAFAACMVIFVFPLFLLGTVTPSLAKYSVDNLADSGKTVGTLGAANTIGSIIGTFLPTFVTIPSVGTSVTFLIFAGILLALAAVYFISNKTGIKKTAAGAVLFVCCCILGYDDSFAFWESNLAYEGESIYNYLQVKESEKDVILSTNVLFGVQSILKKDQGLTGMYYDYAMIAPFMAGVEEADKLDVLILGMGTGTYASQCNRYFDNTYVEGVEIDEKITRLSHEYFELDEGIPVTTYDGRAYLNVDDKKYHVIMVDAYQDITIPFQMSSVEFFTLVKEHLTKDGVMVVNMNMRGQEEGNINQCLSDTIAGVFENVYTVDVSGGTNRELFASDSPDILARAEKNIQSLRAAEKEKAGGGALNFPEALGETPQESSRREELAKMMDRVMENMIPYEKGDYLFTDDKAPVELLGMKVIDDLIGDEVEYYKGIYEREGIEGLLRYL